jgi:hypothetical protein
MGPTKEEQQAKLRLTDPSWIKPENGMVKRLINGKVIKLTKKKNRKYNKKNNKPLVIFYGHNTK